MTNMTYKILSSLWWTNVDGCIGVVAVETFVDEWKAYIGIGFGYSQEGDEQRVAMLGCGLRPEQAHGFFPRFDIEKYKDS